MEARSIRRSAVASCSRRRRSGAIARRPTHRLLHGRRLRQAEDCRRAHRRLVRSATLDRSRRRLVGPRSSGLVAGWRNDLLRRLQGSVARAVEGRAVAEVDDGTRIRLRSRLVRGRRLHLLLVDARGYERSLAGPFAWRHRSPTHRRYRTRGPARSLAGREAHGLLHVRWKR